MLGYYWLYMSFHIHIAYLYNKKIQKMLQNMIIFICQRLKAYKLKLNTTRPATGTASGKNTLETGFVCQVWWLSFCAFTYISVLLAKPLSLLSHRFYSDASVDRFFMWEISEVIQVCFKFFKLLGTVFWSPVFHTVTSSVSCLADGAQWKACFLTPGFGDPFKITSISIPPEESFVFTVIALALPFKGARIQYIQYQSKIWSHFPTYWFCMYFLSTGTCP